jgi:hypothetical protein
VAINYKTWRFIATRISGGQVQNLPLLALNMPEFPEKGFY